jgi:hypothetical protein
MGSAWAASTNSARIGGSHSPNLSIKIFAASTTFVSKRQLIMMNWSEFNCVVVRARFISLKLFQTHQTAGKAKDERNRNYCHEFVNTLFRNLLLLLMPEVVVVVVVGSVCLFAV